MKQNYFKSLIALVLFLSVLPSFAQTLNNITPSVGMEGSTISVAISGQNSNFLQGTTTVWFNQGSSTLFASNVNVNNATSLVAEVGIPFGTPLGLYQTNVQEPIDNIIAAPNSFTIVANPNAPVITNVSPSSTMEGTSLTVSISGQNTNFQQGTTTVWFNQGSSTIYASSVNVGSNTSLNAFFDIPFGTPLGLYGTNVQDPIDNIVTLPNSFTITANPNAPNLVSIAPNNGDLGTTIQVSLSGQNTSFLQGTGTLYFVQGAYSFVASNLQFNTNTQLEATLTIPSFVYPGYYDVYFYSPMDGNLMLSSGFYVNPPPCGNIQVDIDVQPCQIGPASISIIGGYAPYTAIIDGQTITANSDYFDYYPPGIGNFTITSVVDNFGCPATSIDSLIQNNEFSASFTASNGCVGNDVVFSNNIISSAPVNSIVYYYGDGFAGTSFTHTYNYAGSYTPSMQVTNDNGCTLFLLANNPILIFEAPQDSIVSLTNADCGLNNGAFEIIGMGNGPFTYNINGVGGYTSNTPLNTGLAAGNYNINLTDSNGCVLNGVVTIAGVSNLTNITGNIQTTTGINANNTNIKLFSLTDTIGAMSISYSSVTDANGNYSFANLAEGAYVLSAEPDTSLYPNTILTYSNGAAVWFEADTIQISCSSQQVIDFQLLDEIQQTGTAQVGGFVADYSFGMLPNVGIVLYDENTNQPITRTSTDANGNYYLYNLDLGQYSILVDYPGIIHNSQHTFTISGTEFLWDKGYFVDFITRTIEAYFYIVGTNELKDIEVAAFPNPFNESTTISYALPFASNVNIQVYNYLGELVQTLVNESKSAGNYTSVFNTADKSKGVYFIRITTNNSTKTIKVICAD
jgi:hypothetical protein